VAMEITSSSTGSLTRNTNLYKGSTMAITTTNLGAAAGPVQSVGIPLN
jgi:hypothetical protein